MNAIDLMDEANLVRLYLCIKQVFYFNYKQNYEENITYDFNGLFDHNTFCRGGNNKWYKL